MTFTNDMTMMYAVHDALRRDLDHLARITSHTDDDPKRILRAAVGWELFKSYLHVHHASEDEMLWPPLHAAIPADSEAGALLDALEAEHAEIDPQIEAIDTVLADRQSDASGLAELVEALRISLRYHLAHEEVEGLPVIDSAITHEQWQAFGADGARRLGADGSRFMPWVLDGADQDVTATVLGALPPPVRQAYLTQWQPAYAALTLF